MKYLFYCILAGVAILYLATRTSTYEGIQPGDTAQDFSLKTIEGESFQLSAFRGQKIVVLGIGNPFG